MDSIAMHVAAPAVVETEVNDVRELLRRKGPLCVSQITVELHVALGAVSTALSILADRDEAEPQMVDGIQFDRECSPWRLKRTLVRPRR